MKKLIRTLISAFIALSFVFVSCNNDDKDKNIPVAGVTLTNTLDTLALGQTLSLQHTIQPHDATNQSVSWLSSNNTNAIVVGGTVTALRFGSATITVFTQDGNFTDTSQIVVSNANNQFCNMLTPGWGSNLGTVTRGTQEWQISGNGITQIWSDVVTATNCQKTTFAGGSMDNFNADCRSNPNHKGDLFSWCAVRRFANQLCPAPWRVPTTEDFRDLDIAMGGTGNSRTDLDFVDSNYITRWGGAFGGNCVSDGTLWSQGSRGYYWSQSENDGTNGRSLNFDTNGTINPQSWDGKNYGLTLRCVQNQ
jgi:uncharacterized protein (TIGR02145 family)